MGKVSKIDWSIAFDGLVTPVVDSIKVQMFTKISPFTMIKVLLLHQHKITT